MWGRNEHSLSDLHARSRQFRPQTSHSLQQQAHPHLPEEVKTTRGLLRVGTDVQLPNLVDRSVLTAAQRLLLVRTFCMSHDTPIKKSCSRTALCVIYHIKDATSPQVVVHPSYLSMDIILPDHDARPTARHQDTPTSDGITDITMAESPTITVMELSPSLPSTISLPKSFSKRHSTPSPGYTHAKEQPGIENACSMDDDDETAKTSPSTAQSEYAEDIIAYIRELEIQCPPDTEYIFRHSELTWATRRRIIDYIAEVHSVYNLSTSALWTAIDLFDRYLALNTVTNDKRWLVAWTALFIAQKFEEGDAPTTQGRAVSSWDFEEGTETLYYDEIVKVEKDMLQLLEEHSASKYCLPIAWIKDVHPEQKPLVEFLVELAMLDHRFLGVPSSAIAAAAMYTANRILVQSPSDTVDSMTIDSTSDQDLESHFDMLVQNLADRDLESSHIYQKHFTDRIFSARKWAIHSLGGKEKMPSYKQRFSKQHPDTLSNDELLPELPPSHNDDAPLLLPPHPVHPATQSTPRGPSKKRRMSDTPEPEPEPERERTFKKCRRLDQAPSVASSSTETIYVPDGDGDISMDM